MLNLEQQRRYRDDGWLVLPGFKGDDELAAVRRRALEIVEAFDPAEGAGVFTTRDQQRTADAWFLGSGDTVRCFFEDEAFDAQGRLRRAKHESINKIGHALHDLDPVFERFSHGPALAALAADLGLVDPLVRQSMFIFKPPAIGGEVRWHQDATFLLDAPESVVGFWFALEDATRENGCLWAVPGGHRAGLARRFVREGRTTRFEEIMKPAWDEARAVPLEVPKGSVVVLHGRAPHLSRANTSPRSRHAYTLHAVSAKSAYLATNWLRRAV